jgi:hypothetical protein
MGCVFWGIFGESFFIASGQALDIQSQQKLEIENELYTVPKKISVIPLNQSQVTGLRFSIISHVCPLS